MLKKITTRLMRIDFSKVDFVSIGSFALIRLSSTFISFLISWLIIRMYSTQEAGDYLYIYTLIGVLAAVASLGLNQSIVKLFGENGITTRSNRFLQTAILWSLFSVITLVTFLYIASNYLAVDIVNKPEIESLIIAGLLAIVGLVFSALFGHAFQGSKKPFLSLLFGSILGNFIFFIALALQYLGLIKSLGIIGNMMLFSLSCFINAVVSALVWFSQPKVRFIVPTFRNSELFKSASLLWCNQLALLALKHGSVLIAGVYVSSSDIAKLSISLKVSELMNLLLISITLVASPMYSKLWFKKNYSQLAITVKENIRLLGAFGLIMGLAMSVFSDQILSFFGEEYRDSSKLLYILIIGQIVYITFASSINLLVMTGNEKEVLLCAVITSLICLPITFFLISNYNVYGAAFSASINQILLVLSSSVAVRIKLGFWAI